MKWYHQALIALFVVCLVGWCYSKYEAEKKRGDDATQRADSNEAIATNAIKSIWIINSISEANQNAKNQIALGAQRAKDDIKVAVTGDGCANQLVPAGAVKRLREFANSVRTCTNNSATGESHC